MTLAFLEEKSKWVCIIGHASGIWRPHCECKLWILPESFSFAWKENHDNYDRIEEENGCTNNVK